VATETFNRRYNQTLFPLPQPILSQATRVMSLRDGTAKMSKSDPNDRSRINLTDSKDEVFPTSKLSGLAVVICSF
jgi:tryptophanyl-tRNA synthetase